MILRVPGNAGRLRTARRLKGGFHRRPILQVLSRLQMVLAETISFPRGGSLSKTAHTESLPRSTEFRTIQCLMKAVVS